MFFVRTYFEIGDIDILLFLKYFKKCLLFVMFYKVKLLKVVKIKMYFMIFNIISNNESIYMASLFTLSPFTLSLNYLFCV